MTYTMERSSPLAAMQPPSLPFGSFGCRGDSRSAYTESGSNYGGRLGFGPTSFNFKDLSMVKAPGDYFSLKPVRGSSPTASLAADLSQNFHIDQSPQLPTPRRALFSSNLFGTLNGRENLTTPPPPSSSPGPGNDSMDMSPLPHKAPFVVETQIDPTPVAALIDDEHITPSPMESLMDSPKEFLKLTAPQERRRPNFLRPSLSRTKGFTTSAISLNNARVECPPFKFGNGGSTLPPSPRGSFGNIGSPPQRNNRPQSADSPSSQTMGPPRLRQPSFSNFNGVIRGSGAPTGHVRKQSNPLQRPRKQFRRSLSMFEKPQDVMKEAKANFEGAALDSIMDIDDEHKMQLPHFNKEEDSIPRITKETMVDVLDGKFGQCFDRSLIVDCRFEYEYEGGHIDGAVNHNDQEALANKLFEESATERTLLIFHCEYSVHRAPKVAKHVRQRDRHCNAHRYPNLTYPEIYILDGGYSSFYNEHNFRCSPQNYVPMGAKEHESACERGLGRMKQARTKLSRAQTFAFGQHDPALDDSPTAPSRKCSSLHTAGLDIATDDHVGPRKLAQPHRMVSF